MDSNKFGTIQRALMTNLGFDEKALNFIRNIFSEFASPDGKMSKDGFTNFLKTCDLVHDVERANNYFRAFDDRNQGFLVWSQFISGLAALDPSVIHGGDFGELRSRYIFRFYCNNYHAKAIMTIEDFRNLAKDSILLKNPKAAERPAMLNGLIGNHLLSYDSDFSMAKFINKVGTLQLRGTSVLFRAKGPILEILRRRSQPVDEESVMEDVKPVIVQKTKDDAIQTDIDFNVSHSALHVTTAGCIAEKLSDMTDEPSELPTTITQGARTVLQRGLPAETDERLKAINCANDVLRGLDYFYRPYQFKQRQPTMTPRGNIIANGQFHQQKPPLDWYDIKKPKLALCINKLCRYLRPILLSESRCLRLRQPIYILGDLHGNYEDLHEFERLLWPMGPEHSVADILCLGDYVDRGQYGLEVVAYLFALKLLCPHKLYLLRGNHELRDQQMAFDFKKECLEKLGEHGELIWNAINSCFDCLPLAAIIDNKIFCVHGGIPHPRLLPCMDETERDLCTIINQTCACPAERFPIDSVPWEMLWNDPIWEENIAASMLDQRGFCPNSRRGTGHEFSKAALDEFLNRFGLSHLIRAHQVQAAGFQLRYDTKCLTVFSSSMYSGLENAASVVMVHDNSIKVVRFSMPDDGYQISSIGKENEAQASGKYSNNVAGSHKNVGLFAKR